MSDEFDDAPGRSFADEVTADISRDLIPQVEQQEDGRAACLLFLSGPLMGHCVSLTQKPRHVGRADDADIVIKDQGVSRLHARFFLGDLHAQGDDGQRLEPEVYVEDLQSSNGVYVNGRRIERIARLTQGDKVTLGTETVLRFTYQDHLDQDFQQRLLDSALNDALTGVRNRAYFDQQLQYEFDYAARHNQVLAILLLDIDYFKQVNDTHGHLAGDAVLAQLGARLRASVRDEDFLARYGGEEFVMICRGLSNEQGLQLAGRLRGIMTAAPFVYQDIEIALTLSCGVASYPQVRAKEGMELVSAADRALYRAKRAGRDQAMVAAHCDLQAQES